ncbi:MAG: hypothetical protein IJM80_04800 [Firmicutes bacterium]|nr:hypothetical protein [Bacillota bacterium]
MKRSFLLVRKAAVLLLAAVLCLCTAKQLHAYTAYEKVRTLTATVRKVCTITAWHYSGGYWMADNGSGEPRVRIEDTAVKKYGFPKALSQSISADWTIKVPEEVRLARRDGAVIVTDVPENGSCYSSIRSRVYGGEELRIRAEPIIHVSGKSLKDYVPGVRAEIPLISIEYGRNLYALYGKGLKGSTAPGAFSASRPSTVFEPYIHPSMIKNALGTLTDDGYVYAGGRSLPSKGLSVGLLTLIKGGAVGVQFEIPITVYFYAETLVQVIRDAETAVPQDTLQPETVTEEELPAEDPEPARPAEEAPQTEPPSEPADETASDPETPQGPAKKPVQPDTGRTPESPAAEPPAPEKPADPPLPEPPKPVLPEYRIHRAY